MANTFGTGIYPDEAISGAVSEVFSLKPYNIVKTLDLLRPIYSKTSNYGHFGRFDEDFVWEKLLKIEEIKEVSANLSKVKEHV
jgi:S-adenosylmethionine synthetase